MIYVFMLLASLSTAMMTYEMVCNAQSFWATFFTVTSITCWVLSAIASNPKKKVARTTNWLTANYSEEDLQKIKELAMKECEEAGV